MLSARFQSEFSLVFQSTSALAPIDVHKFSHSRIVPIISHPNPTGHLDDDSTDVVQLPFCDQPIAPMGFLDSLERPDNLDAKIRL